MSIPCPDQNLTWLVDLFIMSIASVQPSLVSDTTVQISVVCWSHFRHILKCKHIVWGVICLCFRMCLIQFENKSRNWACLFQESLFVFLHHVTLLLTDMWQQPHANPRPNWNHMTPHTSPVYTNWTTWITDLIPSSVNHPNKDKPTQMSHYSLFTWTTVPLSNTDPLSITDQRWCEYHISRRYADNLERVLSQSRD